MRFVAMLFLGLTLLAAAVADAREAADAPLPMLDTGGHMAAIGAVTFTPDGRQLVSASNDKTIRVWDVATGKTVRYIRGEAAAGDAGKVYAIALSPDGKWLAAGGWMKTPGQSGYRIRLYDFASGKLAALLKGHENIVNDLAFSPDGRRLISGSPDKTAIIWDVAAGKAVSLLGGHRDAIYAVGFTPDGARVVTGSFDHELRLWSAADGALLKTMTGHGDRVRSLAVAPDGRIASGDRSGEIRLWDGLTGAFLKTLAQQKTEVSSLSFSPDGKALLSGVGTLGSGTDCHVYDVASGQETVTYSEHDNIVFATAISLDGRWAATAGGNNKEIHIWDLQTGARRQDADGQPLTLGGTGRPVWAAGFSADGRRIGWGAMSRYITGNNRGPLQHALTLPPAQAALSGPQGLDTEAARAFRRAEASHGGWSLSHRKGGNYGYNNAILDVKQGETVRASIERSPAEGSVHNAYSFTPDGETIISGGGNGVLTAYSRVGMKLGEFIGHEGDVWAVAPSPDGRYLVSGAADQTLRLWNLKTRELLVTLFQGSDGEWVMWTPQGYYAASGPGGELIGWQINHGPENAAEYVTAAQLRKSLNRPDIVARAIELVSAKAAVNEASGVGFKLSDLQANPTPRLRIISPAPGASLSGGKTEVAITLDATPDPVKLIRIQVNGRQIAEHTPTTGGGFTPGAHRFTAPLEAGRNTIRLTAVNQTGETSADVTVKHDGVGSLDKRGALYILAIGVDKYPNIPNNDLRFSGADAKAFAEAMARRAGPLHERTVSRLLVNGGAAADEPTAANILNALGLLAETKETDTIMVFVAGHGVMEGPNYRLLATDAARKSDGGLLPATVVPWYAFQEAIESAKGRRILFLDTCHAGNSYNQRLSNDSYQANIIVFSAARWDQQAAERSDLGGGHGVFTYATVEGVEGKAGGGAGGITTLALRDFLVARVRELAKPLNHEQEPQYFSGKDAGNFVLVRER